LINTTGGKNCKERSQLLPQLTIKAGVLLSACCKYSPNNTTPRFFFQHHTISTLHSRTYQVPAVLQLAQHRPPFNMRNFLRSAIASIILSTTNAKYLPVRVRQLAPTTTLAVLILEQNPGCCLLSSALSVCTSLTPGFTTLAPSQQAPCLCYSSTVWQPAVFDNAVKTCADFASTAVRIGDTLPMFQVQSENEGLESDRRTRI
jgi:hypothetical protein